MSSVRSNESLYQKVIVEAKRKFKVWSSAYASGGGYRKSEEEGERVKE